MTDYLDDYQPFMAHALASLKGLAGGKYDADIEGALWGMYFLDADKLQLIERLPRRDPVHHRTTFTRAARLGQVRLLLTDVVADQICAAKEREIGRPVSAAERQHLIDRVINPRVCDLATAWARDRD